MRVLKKFQTNNGVGLIRGVIMEKKNLKQEISYRELLALVVTPVQEELKKEIETMLKKLFEPTEKEVKQLEKKYGNK